MNSYKNKKMKRISLRKMKNFETYKKWQNYLKKQKEMRIFADLEYDKNRINNF